MRILQKRFFMLFLTLISIIIFSTNVFAVSTLPNADSFLNTPTYDGSGQAVHPSVEYFENGWNGYKYWMGMTPYPNTNDVYENPSIIASNDGINWVEPSGVNNPLAPQPSVGHNNDTELVYSVPNNELYLYYLDADDSSTTYFNTIRSGDGINWTSPATCFTSAPGQKYGIISPSVVYDTNNSMYNIWYVNAGNNGNSNQGSTIEYRSSSGGSWSSPITCNFPAANQLGVQPWHIDIINVPEKNEYWMVFCAYPNGGDSMNQMNLYFAKSSDGINWAIDNNPILRYASGKWDNLIYQTSLLYDALSNKIRLWYSAYSGSDWHVGYTEGNYAEGSTFSTGYYKIQNRWNGSYLYDDNLGKVNYGTGSDDTYLWSIENHDGYTRLKNKSTGKYMHNENSYGYVETGTIQPGWWSADWSLAANGNYTRIQNRWQTNQFMNLETQKGYVESSSAGTNCWSADWTLIQQ